MEDTPPTIQQIESLITKKKYTEALQLAQKFPDKEIDDKLLFDVSIAEAGIGKHRQALEILNELFRKGSRLPIIPYALGQIYEQLNDKKLAVYYYTIAAKIKETSAEAEKRLFELGGNEEVDQKSERLVYIKPVKSKINFSDVAGMKKVKRFLEERVVLAMKKPQLFKRFGKKMGIGLLLYGPPGCGKTFVAEALAGETDAYLLVVRIHQILGSYVGTSEKNLRQVFEQARKNTPCIIFIDEVEGLGGKRENYSGEGVGGGITMKLILNQFLQEMSGIEENPEGIYVIAATNRAWDLDPALKRSGRIGDFLYIPAPNYSERKQAVEFNLRKKKHKRINIGRIARAMAGFSQADIAKTIDDASLKPIQRHELRAKAHKPANVQDLMTTRDILSVVWSHPGSLYEYYTQTRKELVGRYKYEVVDGKEHFSWESSSLEADEKSIYKEMIDDVLWNTNAFVSFSKKFMRYTALFIA